jgi:hypothetical protein
MTWNNVPCHHTQKIVIFQKKKDHGIMYCFFVMTCIDKITCCENNLKFIFSSFQFCQQKDFDAFSMMYMFVNCICTKYVNQHIHQGLNPKPRGSKSRS